MSKKFSFDLNKKILPHFNTYSTYDGVITSEQMSQFSGKDYNSLIRLNANENPFGTHESIIKSLENIQVHLYPDPNQKKIRQTLSTYTNFPVENIMAGAGGDEIIDLLMRLFVSPDDIVIDCPPTFGMYKFASDLCGGRLKSIERNYDWNVNINTIIKKSENAKIIFLASPNNPTGNILTESDARTILETGILLVLDETYFEFSNKTLANMINDYENLVILRSFSKWAGLAGLRIGYTIASKNIINILMQIKQPYNINIAAETAAITAIRNKKFLFENIKILIKQRKRLEKFIEENNELITYYPSSGNFLLCKFEKFSATGIYNHLAEEGVFVRKFSHPSLDKCIRISAGTPNQTDTLLAVLKNIVS